MIVGIYIVCLEENGKAIPKPPIAQRQGVWSRKQCVNTQN